MFFSSISLEHLEYESSLFGHTVFFFKEKKVISYSTTQTNLLTFHRNIFAIPSVFALSACSGVIPRPILLEMITGGLRASLTLGAVCPARDKRCTTFVLMRIKKKKKTTYKAFLGLVQQFPKIKMI